MAEAVVVSNGKVGDTHPNSSCLAVWGVGCLAEAVVVSNGKVGDTHPNSSVRCGGGVGSMTLVADMVVMVIEDNLKKRGGDFRNK